MPMVPQHPKLARVQKSQAPIFQSKPHLAAIFANAPKAPGADIPAQEALLPRVMPLGIFVARRHAFEVMVFAEVKPRKALEMIFDALPLAENGWDIERTKIAADTIPHRWIVWRADKG